MTAVYSFILTEGVSVESLNQEPEEVDVRLLQVIVGLFVASRALVPLVPLF